MAEDYVDSVLELLDYFKVQVYCRIGAMYDSVPHTRPLVVSVNPGSVEPRPGLPAALQQRQSQYEGPLRSSTRCPTRSPSVAWGT